MVVVQNVRKSFGTVPAVQDVSFELKPGQIAGLLGPNGAGKTTTIRMIAGYLIPDAGRVLIGGHDTASAPASARQRLGYLPESNPLYPEMKVREYLDFRAGLFGLPTPLRRKARDWALDRCRVTEMAGRRIGTLSKGYRQRVGLAAALLHNPQVMILDEPTNGLDPSQIHETRALVQDLAKERTMLVSSHILPEVERLCDRVIIMAGGKVHADGSPSDLTRSSISKYIIQTREARVGDNERAHKAFTNMPHVVEVTSRRPEGGLGGLGWTEWVVCAKAGAPDLREGLSQAASQTGLVIRELRADTPTLERVFLQILDRVAGVRAEASAGEAPAVKEAAA